VGFGDLVHSFQTAANYPTFLSDTRALFLNSSHVAFSSHILGSSTIVQRAVTVHMEADCVI